VTVASVRWHQVNSRLQHDLALALGRTGLLDRVHDLLAGDPQSVDVGSGDEPQGEVPHDLIFRSVDPPGAAAPRSHTGR